MLGFKQEKVKGFSQKVLEGRLTTLVRWPVRLGITNHPTTQWLRTIIIINYLMVSFTVIQDREQEHLLHDVWDLSWKTQRHDWHWGICSASGSHGWQAGSSHVGLATGMLEGPRKLNWPPYLQESHSATPAVHHWSQRPALTQCGRGHTKGWAAGERVLGAILETGYCKPVSVNYIKYANYLEIFSEMINILEYCSFENLENIQKKYIILVIQKIHSKKYIQAKIMRQKARIFFFFFTFTGIIVSITS